VENLRSRFCSNACQSEQQYRDFIVAWKAGTESGNRGVVVSRHVRRYLREKYGEQCSRCGWHERNPHNGITHLTVEHRNGNWRDTQEENLDLLCPNCHSLTPTYGILNRGHGRSFRHTGL
jgi:hypothetical protein